MSNFAYPSYTTIDTPGAKLEAKLGEECEAYRVRNQRHPRYIVLGYNSHALIYSHLVQYCGHDSHQSFIYYSEPPIRVLIDELDPEALEVLG